MKSPRELLLARHRAADPKLDAVRRWVLAEHVSVAPGDGERRVGPGLWARVWREVFWSSRWAWAGLAATWLVIVPLHFAAREPVPGRNTPGERRASAPMAHAALAEQHRLKAELLGMLPPSDRPAERSPARPRTEFRGRGTVT